VSNGLVVRPARTAREHEAACLLAIRIAETVKCRFLPLDGRNTLRRGA